MNLVAICPSRVKVALSVCNKIRFDENIPRVKIFFQDDVIRSNRGGMRIIVRK
jgi:hypothetical protein